MMDEVGEVVVVHLTLARIDRLGSFLAVYHWLPLTLLCDQDYFNDTAGPVKRIIANYRQNGQFSGSAVVIFSKPDAAAKAAKADGTKVDGKPLRVGKLSISSKSRLC